MRPGGIAAIGYCRIGCSHVDNLDFESSQRQRGRIFNRRGNAHFFCRADYVFAGQRFRKVNRRQIQRLHQRLVQRDAAIIFFIVIFRFPFADGERNIINAVFAFPAVLQRRQINERLEGRTRLPQRGYRPVKLAFAVIDAADHGFDLAAFVQNNHRTFADIAVFGGKYRLTENFFGIFLNFLIQSRININIIVALADIIVDFSVNPIGKIIGSLNLIRPILADGQSQGIFHLSFGKGVVVDHVLQNHLGPRLSPLGTCNRIVPRRRFKHAGNNRRLKQIHVA